MEVHLYHSNLIGWAACNLRYGEDTSLSGGGGGGREVGGTDQNDKPLSRTQWHAYTCT